MERERHRELRGNGSQLQAVGLIGFVEREEGGLEMLYAKKR